MPFFQKDADLEGTAGDTVLVHDGDPLGDEIAATSLTLGGPNVVEEAIELAAAVGYTSRSEIERVAREAGLEWLCRGV